MVRHCFMAGLFFLCSLGLPAQELSDVEKLLELNESFLDGEGDEEVLATLTELTSAPLNINTAGFDSLKMLWFLSDSQIDNMLAFRKRYGGFLHLNELLLVTGIGKRDLEYIRPFVTTGGTGVRERLQAIRRSTIREGIVRLRLNLPKQEGYKRYDPADFTTEAQYRKKQETRYWGIPLGTLVKYKMQWNKKIQIGIALENDAGEPYFTRYQKGGFDFVAAHLELRDLGRLQRLVVGDFRIQWGQGLLGWGGFSSGKSAMAVGNEKSGKGIVPYSSTDENNFLRGAAADLRLASGVTAEFFLSRKRTDGNVLQLDILTEEELETASLYESGYHRNERELKKKHALRETTAGISAKWNSARARIGVNALYYDFTPALTPGERIYQQYNDNGKQRLLFSVDYKTGWKGVYLYGETAVGKSRGYATVNGLRFSVGSWLAANAVYRRYDKRYISRYAGGFGEYSNTSNEEGFFGGLDLSLSPQLKINVYYDRFRFFAPRYQAYTPGWGSEMLADLVWERGRWEHLFRYKRESKPENGKGGPPLQMAMRKKSEFRYQAAYRHNSRWEWRGRFHYSRYAKEAVGENGFLIYQDIIYSAPKEKMKGQLRLAWFQTDSYNSRIYAYENTVLYGYAFPALYGKGIRTYLNLNWKLRQGITCYAKAGYAFYPDMEYSGSSYTRTEGGERWDFTVQLRFRW
ncbi:MAG: helix-hairpin-helix domain-containing protein [Culturomica sp.]|nr:helix-hairpin-helix domain-containing protein [Culturomica sp.]